MRRLAVLALVLASGVSSLAGCSTYRSDLGRARAHYDKNEYEPALALFRVLEPDLDSFSPAEHAQYAYARGMTDYRLAALASAGTGINDPKGSFRSNARHWLGVARAVDKESPGGLTDDEKGRLEEAMTDLNREVFGEAERISQEVMKAPAKKPEKSDTD